MLFEGKLKRPEGKRDRYWGVEIPLLHISTQGTSRRNALEMAKDAIEAVSDADGFHLKVRIHDGADEYFAVDSNDAGAFIAFMLKRQRQFRKLTVREVAERLNSKSPNSYAQYERGKVCLPSKSSFSC